MIELCLAKKLNFFPQSKLSSKPTYMRAVLVNMLGQIWSAGSVTYLL